MPKREGGGRISVNFTVKQPLPVPDILSNDTIASSRGRDGGETESEREQGNERPRG
ncbi:hypothetical protein NC653_039618 [Populus alba x Populus x berolinensis]|uniref:Uncharacterized protein n=1 Tax=Populus alba x Populus x berolinensis TaxID=444605 RepID=A0AAD6LBN3_9ROSI|nr:hypothetical protein NC653_039618 [Populus alba x Populus x berolinensis]